MIDMSNEMMSEESHLKYCKQLSQLNSKEKYLTITNTTIYKHSNNISCYK